MLKFILKSFFGRERLSGYNLPDLKRVLIVRQHNQLGDLIISTPLPVMIKEYYPGCEIFILLSTQNFKAYTNNPYISGSFVYDKNKLKNFSYIRELFRFLRRGYDLTVVPSITSLSFTSNFLAAISKANIKVGPASLNGEINDFGFFFDYPIDLDWRSNDEIHAAERTNDILKPFGITTNYLKPVIKFSEKETEEARQFLQLLPGDKSAPVIGIHPGAGKIQNRWNAENFANLIEKLISNFDGRIFLSKGGSGDEEVILKISEILGFTPTVFDRPGMPLLAALIEKCDLFITNDTGPMHAAATTNSPVISLFGPTNHKMWAPTGDNKVTIYKGVDINLITVEEVFDACEKLLVKRS
ncbi:MAG: glycosyltransferase family 9 protein [Ignavibacteriaceae bacterium]|nr:glycosyltransferase family 9 protein [Ignavibacteriaceae bacterium]